MSYVIVLDHPANQLPGSSQNSQPRAVETAGRGVWMNWHCYGCVSPVSLPAHGWQSTQGVAAVGDVTGPAPAPDRNLREKLNSSSQLDWTGQHRHNIMVHKHNPFFYLDTGLFTEETRIVVDKSSELGSFVQQQHQLKKPLENKLTDSIAVA